MRIKRLALMGTAAAAAAIGAFQLKKKRDAKNQQPYSYGSNSTGNSRKPAESAADTVSSAVEDSPFARTNQ